MELVSLNEIAIISPILILSLGVMALLIFDVLLEEAWPKGTFTGLTLILALLSAEINWELYSPGQLIFQGTLFADPFSLYFSYLIVLGALLSVLLGINRIRSIGIDSDGEYYALLLMSTIGALIMVSAAEFITFFIGLEVMSMALYCMCGAARRSQAASESAMKYFLLGSFSSAFLLYGFSFLYGLSGSTQFLKVAAALSGGQDTLVLVALGMVLFGVIFKIGAVPFHFWTPDVYEGAPTPVTAFMACVIKAAAVAAGLRIFWIIFEQFSGYWSGAIWLIAALTMIVGNFVALRQRSVKRMLAYSSIAHAGYMLIAFLAPGGSFGGGAAVLYYMVTYTMMTLGAFGVTFAVSGSYGNEDAPADISRFYGLGQSKPVLAFVMTVFMLALAGIPPGMGGFLGKVYVFSSAIKADYIGLAVLGVLCSLVSCYYYLRVIVAMYFIGPDERLKYQEPFEGVVLNGALGLCAIAVVLVGLFPGYLYDTAASIMNSF